LNILHHIIFTGVLDDVGQILIFSDLYVSTSNIESFGISVVEAMHKRIPVIAFSVGGIVESVIQDKTGFLVDLYDTDNLARGILDVRQRKQEKDEKLDQIISDAADLVNQRYSIDKTVADLENFYANLVGSK
jgi:glycosyltransferase involved in cell wall biosynthesis